MQTDIIEAILDIEQKAQAAVAAIQREKDKLPSRIAAETEHIRQKISQETSATIREIREEAQNAADAQVAYIQEKSAIQLAEFEASFNKEVLREELFQRLTKWII